MKGTSNRSTPLQRAVEAIERAEETASLTPQQRLARLDARLGKDIGARKERIRLERLIENEKRTER